MNYLQNHIWCSESNWGGVHYDCRHLVDLKDYEPHDRTDWSNIVDYTKFIYCDKDYAKIYMERMAERGIDFTQAEAEDMFTTHRKIPTLKPEVFEWLEQNVKDRNGEGCVKGWCIGSEEYRRTNTSDMCIFFHRRSDAMAFIRVFSVYKKPVHYCQYFSDVRKRLNLETMKYEG